MVKEARRVRSYRVVYLSNSVILAKQTLIGKVDLYWSLPQTFAFIYSNYPLVQIIRQRSLWSALVTASYLPSVLSSVFTGCLHVRLVYLQLLTSLIFTSYRTIHSFIRPFL